MDSDLHVRAIVDRLETEGLVVGDGVAPTDGNNIVAPCIVVFLLPGGEVDGAAADPDADYDLRFQTTAIGRNAAEARYYADLAADALQPLRLEVEGRSIERCRPVTATGGVDRDDEITPPLFYAVRTWGIWSFPTVPVGS